MSYTVEDFEFTVGYDGGMALVCPHPECIWEFDIVSYLHGIGDVVDNAVRHLREAHDA